MGMQLGRGLRCSLGGVEVFRFMAVRAVYEAKRWSLRCLNERVVDARTRRGVKRAPQR